MSRRPRAVSVHWKPRWRLRQSGVAAIELALIATFFLIPLATGVAELGHALYTYDVLAKQARSAARYYAINSGSSANAALEARNIAVCGLPVCGTAPPAVPGLALAHVAAPVLSDVSTGATTGTLRTVTLSITFPFQPWIRIVNAGWTFLNLGANMGPIRVTMPRAI